MPCLCLYDKAKVVILRWDEEKHSVWNRQILEFTLRAGLEVRHCRLYRAQTKGKIESGVKFVKGNTWPGMRFADDAYLNRQAVKVVLEKSPGSAGWCGQRPIGPLALGLYAQVVRLSEEVPPSCQRRKTIPRRGPSPLPGGCNAGPEGRRCLGGIRSAPSE